MTTISSRRTPYDDRYGSCADTCATLLVYPASLHPTEVTVRLGLQPSDLSVVGGTKTNPSGRTRTAKTSSWMLSSEGQVQSLDLRRHLDWLLDLLTPRKDALFALQNTQGLVMSVNCPWYSRAGQGGPTLWPEQMERLAELNLELSFDIYFLGDDEDLNERSS